MAENDAPLLTGTNNPMLKARAIKLRLETSMTHEEIAKELDCARQTVTRWLNDRDVKDIVQAAMNKFKTLIEASVGVYAHAINNKEKDPTNALKAAKDILKTHGIVKEDIEITHIVPRPTVIKRVDGTEIILGTEKHVKEEGES
jgi:DNA-binding XRE family transcriptional regulator